MNSKSRKSYQTFPEEKQEKKTRKGNMFDCSARVRISLTRSITDVVGKQFPYQRGFEEWQEFWGVLRNCFNKDLGI